MDLTTDSHFDTTKHTTSTAQEELTMVQSHNHDSNALIFVNDVDDDIDRYLHLDNISSR